MKELVSKIITIKSNQGFNENNLMCLPIFSIKRNRVGKIKRIWYRNNQEVELTIIGGAEYGVPNIKDMDVLLALFKLMTKHIDNKIIYEDINKPQNIPKVINFTYRSLSKEMGLRGFGNKTKERLEKSIRTLTETTIYSNLSLRNQETGEYIIDFKGEESFRIIDKYKSYSISKRKKMNQNLLSPKEIEEVQSVEIGDFFYNNIMNNYFKLYDYNKYMLLNSGIAKKLLLILSTWSHGYEKYITLAKLYDYIGIEISNDKDVYYYNQKMKIALNELVSIDFINSYEFYNNKGILFVFKSSVKKSILQKYTTYNEVIDRLLYFNIDVDDIYKYYNDDTHEYISALLRYVDDRIKDNKIDNVKKFIYKGLPHNSYNVKKYLRNNWHIFDFME